MQRKLHWGAFRVWWEHHERTCGLLIGRKVSGKQRNGHMIGGK